jgi:hypothetical protein
MNYLKNYFKKDDKTEFNSTFACYERIHWLLIDCSDHSRLALINGCNTHYLNLWKTTILVLYREIMPSLAKDEYTKANSEFETYHKQLNSLGNPIKKEKNEDGETLTKIDKKIFLKAWNILNSMELFLRVKANDLGMLIKKKQNNW